MARGLKKYQEETGIFLGRQFLVEGARLGLLTFTVFTKDDYEVNWHHELICDKLNDFINGRIKRLMIFAPPRTGKSELTSRRLPAFIHGKFPNDEIMAASYSMELASDMTVDVQRIMDTPEYAKVFPNSRVTPEGSRSDWVRNQSEHELMPLADGTRLTGKYRGQGVGGTFTGRGAKWILIDDPIKGRKEADSKPFRDHLWKWYSSDLRSRLAPDGGILITLTRWHEDDLAGRLLALAKADPNADQWEVLSLPAICEETKHPEDPRQVGEAIWPARYSVKDYAPIKALSERDWSALYQQRPTASEGGMIKRDWIQFYTSLPAKLEEQIQSWDLSFKESASSDYVSGQCWGRFEADVYLIDRIHEKMDFPKTIAAIQRFCFKHPKAHAKYIEDKANGPAVISTLKSKIMGIVPVSPKESKEERVAAVSPIWASMNVWLPDPSIAPWVNEFIEELVNFPNAPHDDEVDAMSQALLKLRSSSIEQFRKLVSL